MWLHGLMSDAASHNANSLVLCLLNFVIKIVQLKFHFNKVGCNKSGSINQISEGKRQMSRNNRIALNQKNDWFSIVARPEW